MSKKLISKKEGRVIEKVVKKRSTTPEDSSLSEECSDDEEDASTFFGERSSDDEEDASTFFSERSSDDEEDETSECLAKFVLRSGRYFVETTHPDIVKAFEEDPEFQECRINHRDDTFPAVSEIPSTTGPVSNSGSTEGGLMGCRAMDQLADEEGKALNLKTISFEVNQEKIEQLQQRCRQLKYPLVSEYEFRRDTISKNIEIDLKPSTKLRPHQEDSLRKVFDGERARSGIIVLPCGAGKSLVGVAACCRLKRRSLVVCNTTTAARQWNAEFLKWSNVHEGIS